MTVDEALEWIVEDKQLIDDCIENIKTIAKSDLETTLDKFTEKLGNYFTNLKAGHLRKSIN